MISSAYLAGFFDGEGTIRIIKTKPNQRWGIVSPRYAAGLTLPNTHLQTLKEIRASYGGRLNHAMGTNLPCYRLEWSSRQVEPLLTIMLPHLRVKRQRAFLLLRFIYYAKAVKHPGGKARRKSDVEMRERFYLALRKLNHPS